MSKFELDTTGADVSIEVSGGSVHLGVFNQDIDGGDYADAYLTPTEARQIAAALTAAADDGYGSSAHRRCAFWCCVEGGHMSGWGGYSKNVFYDPEACGLRLIGELEDADASYDFNTIIVLQDVETGRVYAGHDSGCSCPTPFEDVRSLGDLAEIRDVAELRSFVKSKEEYVNWPLAEQQDLYRKVQGVLASNIADVSSAPVRAPLEDS